MPKGSLSLEVTPCRLVDFVYCVLPKSFFFADISWGSLIDAREFDP